MEEDSRLKALFKGKDVDIEMDDREKMDNVHVEEEGPHYYKIRTKDGKIIYVNRDKIKKVILR